MSKKNETFLQISVGAFILIGIVMLMLLILNTTAPMAGIKNPYLVTLQFEGIGALKKGAPVKQGGVDIGYVNSIHLDSNENIVNVEIKIDESRWLAEDASARISTLGIMGDSFVEIYPGKSNIRSTTNKIRGTELTDFNKLAAEMGNISQGVQDLLQSLNKLIGDETMQMQIQQTVSSIEHAAKNADTLFGILQIAMEMVLKTINGLEQTITEAEGTIKTVHTAIEKTFAAPEQIEAINQMVQNMRNTVSMVYEKSPNIASIIENIEAVTKKIKDISDELDTKKGIFRIFTDDALVDDIQITMSEIKEMAAAINGFTQITAKMGLSAILSDLNIANRVADQFYKDCKKLPPEEILKRWNELRARLNSSNQSIMRLVPLSSTTSKKRMEAGEAAMRNHNQ